MILIWDEWNEGHIAEHAVSPEEAAALVEIARRPYPQRIAPGRFMVRGRIANGRFLQVVYVIREPDTIDVAALGLEDRIAVEAGELIGYVIHARDLGRGEKRTVRKRNR